MFIKIESHLIAPLIYRFDNDEVFIGSAPGNHIVINLPSVSKYHLKLFCEGSNYFAQDLGSTNGTYLVDQKIKKDKKIGLLPGETVRLGDSVHVTLAEEADQSLALGEADFEGIRAHLNSIAAASAKAASNQDKTQVISLSALEQAKIVAAKKRKEQLKAKQLQEKKRKKAERNATSRVIIYGLVIMALGWGANKWWLSRKSKVAKNTIIKTMQDKASGDSEIEVDLEGFRISRGALEKRSQLSKMLTDPKCLQEETKIFCEDEPLYTIPGSGVLFRTPGSYFFFVEEKGYLANVRSLLRPEDKLSNDALGKFAFLHFYKEHVSEKEFPQDAQIYVVFYNVDQQDQKTPSIVSALKQTSAGHIKNLFTELNFPGPYEDTEKVLKKFDVYYTQY